jgi:hypothetical protein
MDSATALALNDYPPSLWSPPPGFSGESHPQSSRPESLSLSATRRRWCLVAWVFIGLVSAYDAWLVKAYEQVIFDVEKNPLARYILLSSDRSVEPFLCCKAAGTLLVLTILWLLYRHTPRLAWPVIQSVAAFQLLLLVFLHVAEH